MTVINENRIHVIQLNSIMWPKLYLKKSTLQGLLKRVSGHRTVTNRTAQINTLGIYNDITYTVL